MSKPFVLRTPRRRDEAEGQEHVVKMLRAYMPDGVWWSFTLSGVPLPKHTAMSAKRLGLERGCPDFLLLLPDGVCRFIEMKSLDGRLTTEQRHVETLAGRHNFKVVHCYPNNAAQTWGEFRRALDAWMLPLGLAWLTDTESFQREQRRRAA